jgi:hypothetical protein
MDFLDTYSIKARLFPALIVILPALVLLLMIGQWKDPGLPELLFSLGIAVLFFAVADLARRAGRRAQSNIFNESEGRPVNNELRRDDSTIDSGTKDRYRNFISEKIGKVSPSVEEEASDPKSVDNFYTECFTYLRNSTYDTETFRVLFNENITFGFRRNLYGLRPYGVAINLIALILAAFIHNFESELISISRSNVIIQGAFALLHAAYFIAAVTKASVIDASKTYARQLVMSCEVLMKGS